MGRRTQDLGLYLRALSDRKRLAILRHLAEHEPVTVTQLGEALRMSQPLMSWHLRALRRAELVTTRRVGRQVLCSLDRRTLTMYQERIDDIFGLRERHDLEAASQPRSLQSATQG